MFKGCVEKYNLHKITENCKLLWSQTHHVANYRSFHKSIWNMIIVAKHGRQYEFGILTFCFTNVSHVASKDPTSCKQHNS